MFWGLLGLTALCSRLPLRRWAAAARGRAVRAAGAS